MAKHPGKNRTPEASSTGRWIWRAAGTAVIVGVIFWIFQPALHGDWLWDDTVDVSKNGVIHDPGGLWKIWFQPGSQLDYYPVKASVQWVQWQLWHNETFGYHLTNVLLHALNALLVWRLLAKLGLRLAWLGGLLFAIHPAQVESVAWIAELKNTLSLPPFLLAMGAWIDYENRGRSRDYFLALGLFLIALLAKPTMVMFPFVILLYAWWKRGRVTASDLRAGTPFFALSLLVGWVTVEMSGWYLKFHHLQPPVPFHEGLPYRLALAGPSLAFYFSTCFAPVGLVPLYPKWTVDPSSLLSYLPWPILGGVLFWLWTRRAGWGRHALLGFGFFLILLVPFIGLVPASYMKFTWVMDHFLYIPIIGLIGLVVAGCGQLEARLSFPGRMVGIAAIVAVTIFLTGESRAHARLFVNQENLWSHVLRHNPDVPIAHNNLGLALFQRNQVAEAIEHYERALKTNPDYVDAHNNLGVALLQANRIPESVAQYEETLTISPGNVNAHFNLAIALVRMGRIPEGITHYEWVIKNDPDNADAHNNLGNVMLAMKRYPEAIDHYEQALKLNPAIAVAHHNLGLALSQTGRVPEALDQYEQAVKLSPRNVAMHATLAEALAKTGRMPEAMEHYRIILKLDPGNAAAQSRLAPLEGGAPAVPETSTK